MDKIADVLVKAAWIILVSMILWGIIFIFSLGIASAYSSPDTILVGTGCQGESPIAVAYEESAMPECASIERHEVLPESH